MSVTPLAVAEVLHYACRAGSSTFQSTLGDSTVRSCPQRPPVGCYYAPLYRRTRADRFIPRRSRRKLRLGIIR